VASAVGQKLAGGFRTVQVEPSPESVLGRIGEGESGVVLLDVLQKGSDVLELAGLLAEVRPRSKVVILGGTADLEVVARAIVAKAGDFLLDTAPAGDFTAAITAVIAGRQPGEDTVYGRVLSLLPMPTGKEGAFRNHAGRRFATEDAIRQCDQLGIFVDEIAVHLGVPVADVERITKKARRAPKPSVIPQLVGSTVAEVGVKLPSRRTMLTVAAVLIAAGAVVQYLSWKPRRAVISGAVTFEGTPVPAGLIRFTPRGEKTAARAIVAGEIRDGRYAVQAGHGSVGGGYRVHVRGFTGVAKQVGPAVDPLGEPLFKEVVRTADIPCGDFTFDVTCD
jgi:DNA-binding NarL/FixJ family response regulator